MAEPMSLSVSSARRWSPSTYRVVSGRSGSQETNTHVSVTDKSIIPPPRWKFGVQKFKRGDTIDPLTKRRIFSAHNSTSDKSMIYTPEEDEITSIIRRLTFDCDGTRLAAARTDMDSIGMAQRAISKLYLTRKDYRFTVLIRLLMPMLVGKYEKTECPEDLDEAIRFAENHSFATLSTLNEFDPIPSTYEMAADLYSRRFYIGGDVQDMERAILLMEIAKELTVHHCPVSCEKAHSALFHNYGILLYERCCLRKTTTGSEDAIQMIKHAIAHLGNSEDDRARYLNSLGTVLHWLFQTEGGLRHLTEAIENTTMAFELLRRNEMQCADDEIYLMKKNLKSMMATREEWERESSSWPKQSLFMPGPSKTVPAPLPVNDASIITDEQALDDAMKSKDTTMTDSNPNRGERPKLALPCSSITREVQQENYPVSQLALSERETAQACRSFRVTQRRVLSTKPDSDMSQCQIELQPMSNDPIPQKLFFSAHSRSTTVFNQSPQVFRRISFPSWNRNAATAVISFHQAPKLTSTINLRTLETFAFLGLSTHYLKVNRRFSQRNNTIFSFAGSSYRGGGQPRPLLDVDMDCQEDSRSNGSITPDLEEDLSGSENTSEEESLDADYLLNHFLNRFASQEAHTLLRGFNGYYHRQYGNQSRGTPTSGHGESTSNAANSAQPAELPRSNKRPYHPPQDRGYPGPESESDEEEFPRKRIKTTAKSELGAKPRRLKCPYYQRQPDEYQDAACRGKGFNGMGKLKDHLKRNHVGPDRCPRCWREFESSEHMDEHLQRNPACVTSMGPPDDRVSLSKLDKLKFTSGVFAGAKNVEEKWTLLYKKLFPKETFIPSPYECVGLDAGAERRFVEIFEEEILKELDPAIQQLRNKLSSIMQRTRDRYGSESRQRKKPRDRVHSTPNRTVNYEDCRHFTNSVVKINEEHHRNPDTTVMEASVVSSSVPQQVFTTPKAQSDSLPGLMALLSNTNDVNFHGSKPTTSALLPRLDVDCSPYDFSFLASDMCNFEVVDPNAVTSQNKDIDILTQFVNMGSEWVKEPAKCVVDGGNSVSLQEMEDMPDATNSFLYDNIEMWP